MRGTCTLLSRTIGGLSPANHRTDISTQRIYAALVRDVAQVFESPVESLFRTAVSHQLWLDTDKLENP